MTKHGTISINTTNILPIIKQWLYSERDVFIRELVSNAYDAITKRKHLDADFTDAKISITINQSDKTVTISDTGIGMTEAEIEQYITQIAFSSAAAFADKFKEDTGGMIGHFGLGFYAAFMVANPVKIRSRSYLPDSDAVLWTCDGSPEYTLEPSTRDTIGTDIILHITEDSAEFLEEIRLKTVIETYVNFLPIPIELNGKVVNHQKPLWVEAPNTLTKDQYQDFYKHMFPFQPEPLFWIHLNVDYPFKLTGILYFPKIMRDPQKGQVKLYCKQVFVSDTASDVIPEFLTLLQGALDCPDIPLNVSRSSLKNDPYVQKIGKHIVKKVADKLNQLSKTDANQFEAIISDISPFIKYGMMQNGDFYDKLNATMLFESTHGKTTLADYHARNQDKLGNKVIYCSDPEAQSAYVTLCKSHDLELLLLPTLLDTHFIQFLESKQPDTTFVSVDSDLLDNFIDDQASSDLVDDNNQTESDRIEAVFKKSVSLTIQVSALKNTDISGMITESEQAKRLRQMQQFMQGDQLPDLTESKTLVINKNNPLVQQILTVKDSQLQTDLCRYIAELAQLSNRPLTGDALQQFLARSHSLLSQLAQTG